jgi:hypothetical protein
MHADECEAAFAFADATSDDVRSTTESKSSVVVPATYLFLCWDHQEIAILKTRSYDETKQNSR